MTLITVLVYTLTAIAKKKKINFFEREVLLKKILFFIIIMFFAITKVNVKASEVTLVKERIDDVYCYYYDDNFGKYRFFYVDKYLLGENYGYCIQLGKKIEGNIYSYTTSFDDANISNSDLEYIKLVSYYGYDYPGHKTDKYYIATQELIWSRLSNVQMKWVVNLDPNDLFEIQNEKDVILNLVSNHYTKPSFDNNTVDIVKGEKITLTDTNNVISNYKSDSNYIKINGNSITIDGNIDVDKVTLTKNVTTDKVFLLYTNGNSQKMMSSGKVEPVTSKINLNILSGSVTIHKKDIETGDNPQGDGSLKGAKYNLYDSSGILKGTFITGKKEKIDNLSPGKYYLKEIEPSIGYQLDDNIYNIIIEKDNLDIEVTVYEKIIKRRVDIFKSYASSDTGLLTPEEGVVFEVYNKDNILIDSLVTDKDGFTSIYLPYGFYTLKQITSSEGYEKIEDYHIIINEYDDRPIYKLFTNAEIKSRIKIIKKDFETKEIITNSDAKFKIYDVKNNKFISFKITYPEEKTIDTFEVKDGIFITPEELSPGTYRLFEVDEKMNGYLYNDEGIEFKIGESSNFIKDEEYGNILEVSFYNTPVKGKIEIYKYGEDIIYQDDTYKYKEILLSNVKFGLYSKNNIYQNNKLVYSKDEFIKELTTDENGYSMIDNLPLGDYYLKEISSSNDNNVSNLLYDISLTYEDQYTEKVIKNVDIYNYLKKGILIINKYDKNTNAPLPNTLIEIRKKDNTIVYKGYTDDKGQIIINDLKYGEYYLAETEATTGYKLLEEDISFTIDKEETIIDIYNERISVPDTGLNINIKILLMVISILFSVMILILTHNKLINILCVIIITLSCLILLINYFLINIDKTKNTKAVEAYLTNKISDTYNEKYRYKALLEIPSINLKRGILDINNHYNKSKYNIELIKEEPDIIILAAHNGNYYNSFFRNLSSLELGETINYYKDGNIYKYIYSDSYEIRKDGYADIYYKKDNKSIILITCKDNTDDAQIVHIGYLKEVTPTE